MFKQLGVSNSGFLLRLNPAYFLFTHSSEKEAIAPSASLHLHHGAAAVLVDVPFFLK